MSEPGRGGQGARRDQDGGGGSGSGTGQYLMLLGLYERHGRWDDYMRLAGSPRFLAALANQPRHGDPPEPLRTLDTALKHAIRLGRVPDMAALVLARARWTGRLAIGAPLDAVRGGSRGAAGRLSADPQAQSPVLWSLLLAWELRDAGNLGEARQVLGGLVRDEQQLLTSSRHGDWAAILLPHALEIDEGRAARLLRLLDDNALTDLARRLTESGALGHARLAAEAIRLFTGNKVSALTEIAIKQAMAEDQPGAAETIALATAAMASPGEDEERPGWLAGLAAAQALQGDRDGAERTFGDARAAANRLPRPSAALAATAAAQARADWLDAAAGTIGAIDDHQQKSEAAAALVVALAERGDVQAAVSVLPAIWAGSAAHGRAARAILTAVAGTDPAQAVSMAGELVEAGQREGAVASVARSAARAGHGPAAIRIASGLTGPGWRARALVDLAAALGHDTVPADLVRTAITAAGGPGLQAILLAEYGVTGDREQGSQLVAEAITLAGQVPRAERWETLATIGHVQGEAGLAGGAETFATARRALLARYDPQEAHRELRELCRLQEQAGDPAGARDTIATALAGRAPDPDAWLIPLGLVAMAVAEVEADEPEAARRALQVATSAAQDLRGDRQLEVTGAIARAQAIAGEFTTARNTVLGLLDESFDEDDDLDDEEPGDDDDDLDDGTAGILAAVQAGVAVARELVKAGQRDSAAELLRAVSQVAVRRLDEHLAFRDVIEGLAMAQADAGALDDALATAALDWTPTARSAALAVFARRQAKDGDLAGAAGSARTIVRPSWRARALAGIARDVTGDSGVAAVAEMLAEAASEVVRADADVDPCDLVHALADIAETQAAIGQPDAARNSLARAGELAARIPPGDDHARELAGIVRAWSALGDHGQALRLAERIASPGYRGDALVAAIAAAAVPAGSRADARAGADLVDEPGYRALALASVILASHPSGPSGPPDDEGGTPDLTEVEGLINRVAEGSPRTRLLQQLIELFIEHRYYATAADLTERMSVSPGDQLIAIVTALADEGARDAVARILPRCARYPESAYAACLALARSYPECALDIAAAVARGAEM